MKMEKRSALMFSTNDITALKGVTAMKKPWQRAGRIFSISATLLLSTLSHAQTIVLDKGVGTVLSTYPIGQFSIPVSIFGGASLSVDSSGNRTMVSDLGNSALGPISSGNLSAVSKIPSDMLGMGRTILALDSFAGTNQSGALIAINPTSGQRSLVSDFGNPNQGLPLGGTPRGVVASPGVLGFGTAIYIIDNNTGTNGHGLLTKIDPHTGNRTVLSDFGDNAQGPLGSSPTSIALAPAGMFGLEPKLLVLDTAIGTYQVGVLFVVDSRGNRTTLSDLGSPDQGQTLGVSPQKVAVFPGGMGESAAIYVIDSGAGSDVNNNAMGALFRIDPNNGNRTLVSDFGDLTKGVGDDLSEITTTASGDLLVYDDLIEGGTMRPKLLLIDHVTGQRTIASDCRNTALGPCGRPIGLTQLP